MTSSFTPPAKSIKRAKAQVRALKRSAKKFPGSVPKTITVEDRAKDLAKRDQKAVEIPKGTRFSPFYRSRRKDAGTDRHGKPMISGNCAATFAGLVGMVAAQTDDTVELVIIGTGEKRYLAKDQCIIIDPALLDEDVDLIDELKKMEFLYGE